MKTYKIFILTVLFFIFGKLLFSQTVFYSDVFYGGVTAGGFSTGMGSGNGVLNLFIEPGSSIRKAFVFAYSTNGQNQTLDINGTTYIFDSTNIISTSLHKNVFFSPIYLHCIDITTILNISQSSIFSINIPLQAGMPYKGVFAPFIYIAYVNPVLAKTSVNIIINKQKLLGSEYYTIANVNPINTGFPSGFSLYTDRSMDGNPVNGKVIFNGNILGIIGGSDNVNSAWNYAGVKGHFYYQNNTLYGLDDDTPDAIMGGTDGLADVSSYLISNSTTYNFKLQDINYPNQPPNTTHVNLAYFLTYTTPCDTFATSLLTEDTMVCMGNTVQLGASGGNTTLNKPAYEWLPQKDLSCYDCPNPVFSGDTSRVYTVRIWNTDSCSKVLPVRVKVLPQPKFGQIYLTSTPCGTNNGKITVSSPAGDSLFVNNNFAGLVPATVSGLAAGQYALQLKDTLGCSSTDSVVQIAVQNPPNALFSLIPPSGAAPLTVQANNQSSHANTYQWVWQNQSSTAINPTFQFDTSGTYTITLIASQNGACADTFSLALVVYESLQITVPNIFTPNNDGVNEVFSITTNQELPVKLSIQNRWGNDVFTFEGVLKTGENKLWNGEDVTEGVYFVNLQYINPKDKKQVSFQGFVSVSR